jgi:hypothetical protein
MAQPRNPLPPSPPPGDDDDLSLDDIGERPQQRPRLPEQRAERQPFEGSDPATAGPARTPGPSPPAEPRGWEPVPHEEIASYDPTSPTGGTALGASAPAAPATPAKASLQPTAGLDDLEEFIARTAGERPPADGTERKRSPFTLLEKVCTGAGLLVLVILSVWLFRAVASEANGVPPASAPWPDTPMEGKLLTISEAVANWRPRTDTDRVAMMEVIMPAPGRQHPEFVPQVVFNIDSSASNSGYLRFIFRDSYGKPRGDTRVVQVENGKLRSMDQGEVIKGDTEGSVYCSEGMLSIHAYYSYKAEDVPRWSVEVAESAAYGAADKEWNVLGTFDIRDEQIR